MHRSIGDDDRDDGNDDNDDGKNIDDIIVMVIT